MSVSLIPERSGDSVFYKIHKIVDSVYRGKRLGEQHKFTIMTTLMLIAER
jgi:hypothetical protein